MLPLFRHPIRTTLVLIPALAASLAAAETLFDFEPGFDLKRVETRDAEVALHGLPPATSLEVTTGTTQRWPGITLKPAGGVWDLSGAARLALDVENVGEEPLTIHCRMDSPAGGKRVYYQENTQVGPGQRATFQVNIRRRLPTAFREKLFGMRGYPGGLSAEQGIDPAEVDAILIFVAEPAARHMFRIDSLRTEGASPAGALPESVDKLFPLIDTFGQYAHKDWPRKTHSQAALAEFAAEERGDLAAHPGPADWNEYGGWAAGPQLEATGHFYPKRHRGKWWLVDPAGRLFWSHGIDCVRPNNAATPITDREHWFAALPERDAPMGAFFGRGSWAPHGYYQGRHYETFNFTAANLLRKYGPDWQEIHARLCHRRLRSWAMNTIGNWSDEAIYRHRKTPYTVSISAARKPIEGSSGYWGKFPDPFEPDFRASLAGRMADEKGKSADDPWCLGYFVDNELAWGAELSLALAALASPAEQAAKQAFLQDLKQKYATIERLNEAWQTEHESWHGLAASRTPPEEAKAREDLAAFATRVAEQYFRVCREVVKQAAPNTMYLGCRFAWVNDRAVRAAAGVCDVISFNRYQASVVDLALPEGVDRPVVIGEFHFGALDRGMFHTGLRPVPDQDARAAAYKSYVTGALENPWIVGTHWFQFGDQATTGRGDGENYQIGFLDVCDTPYLETIRAAREVGDGLYAIRAGRQP